MKPAILFLAQQSWRADAERVLEEVLRAGALASMDARFQVPEFHASMRRGVNALCGESPAPVPAPGLSRASHAATARPEVSDFGGGEAGRDGRVDC